MTIRFVCRIECRAHDEVMFLSSIIYRASNAKIKKIVNVVLGVIKIHLLGQC